MVNDISSDLFPEASVAVHFMVASPISKTEPGGGVHSTIGEGSTVSVAVGRSYSTSPSELIKTIRSETGSNTGGVVSTTVIV